MKLKNFLKYNGLFNTVSSCVLDTSFLKIDLATVRDVKVGGFHLDSGSLRFAVFQFVARMRKARERKQGKPDRKFSFSTIKIQGSEMKLS